MINYQVQWQDVEETFIGNNHNYSLYASPLPGSGPLLSFIFNVLNGLEISDTPKTWSKIIETFKFAYGLRTKLGDPGYVEGLHSVSLFTKRCQLLGFLYVRLLTDIK